MVAVITIIAGFQVINPSFLSYQGIITLVYAMSYFLIAACGLTFVIMMGSFDFSVVSLLKIAALLCVLYIDRLGLWVIPLSLLIGVGFGFINGLLVAMFNVPSFMATLGVSVVVEGIGLYLSKGFLHIIYDETFRALATAFIAGLPSIFYWAMGIWILSIFIAMCMPFGRRIYAVGGNSIGAGLSGINVKRYRIYVFMLSGLFAGLAGVLYMAQLGGGLHVDWSRYAHTALRERGRGRHSPHGRCGRPAQNIAWSDYHNMDTSGDVNARNRPRYPDGHLRLNRVNNEYRYNR